MPQRDGDRQTDRQTDIPYHYQRCVYGRESELARAANECKVFCFCIPTVEICPTRKSEPKVSAARKVLRGGGFSKVTKLVLVAHHYADTR